MKDKEEIKPFPLEKSYIILEREVSMYRLCIVSLIRL